MLLPHLVDCSLLLFSAWVEVPGLQDSSVDLGWALIGMPLALGGRLCPATPLVAFPLALCPLAVFVCRCPHFDHETRSMIG